MLALDSLRWNDLRHAYGPAGDIPALISSIAAERSPNFSDGGAWFEVYSRLFHQYSYYSGTCAAIPHLSVIAETGTYEQLIAVVCLTGEILVFGQLEAGPVDDDLISDMELAIQKIRRASLLAVENARSTNYFEETNNEYASFSVGDFLLAFGGLRHPTSGFVAQLGYLEREDWQLEPECPSCKHRFVAKLGLDKIELLTPEKDSSNLKLTGTIVPQRAAYRALVDSPEAIEIQNDWSFDETANVLAGLALRLGNNRLAQAILDMVTEVGCPLCSHAFELSEGLRPV